MATEQQDRKLMATIIEHSGVLGLLSPSIKQWAIENGAACNALIFNRLQKLQESGFKTEFLVQGKELHVTCDGSEIERLHRAKFDLEEIDTDEFELYKSPYRGLGERRVYLLSAELAQESFRPALEFEFERRSQAGYPEAMLLISRQPQGEEGHLLTDGKKNVFWYSPQCLLTVFWSDAGWRIDKVPINWWRIPQGSRMFFHPH